MSLLELRALAACAGLGLCTVAGGAPLPGKNLDFQAWTAEGKPEGWNIREQAAYSVSRDCQAAPTGLPCAVKIEGVAGATGFLPLTQVIPPGDSLEKGALLTGWIRTEGVRDGAMLWVVANGADGRPLRRDNMQNRRVQGTTQWTRFSVQVPVVGSTRSLGFGVILEGPGTAWFADLRLTSDDSVKAPSDDLPAR